MCVLVRVIIGWEFVSEVLPFPSKHYLKKKKRNVYLILNINIRIYNLYMLDPVNLFFLNFGYILILYLKLNYTNSPTEIRLYEYYDVVCFKLYIPK